MYRVRVRDGAAGPAVRSTAETGEARLPAGTAGGLRPDLAGSKVPHEKENAKEESTPDRCGDGGGFVMGMRENGQAGLGRGKMRII